MEEWIPYLLVIVGWPPEKPDLQQIVRVDIVADQAECDLLGDEFVATRYEYREELGDAGYRYFCAPLPDREQFDEAFERMLEQQRDREGSARPPR